MMKMNIYLRLSIIALVVIASAATLYYKNQQASEKGKTTTVVQEGFTTSSNAVDENRVDTPLPRLLDLGADKCIPCKMMMPVLDGLHDDFPGQLTVDFVDVWKDESVATAYGIRLIPTQIFFDVKGKELFRHEGFFSRKDILAKWKELGYAFTEAVNDWYEAIYLHPTFRCVDCVTAEKIVKQALDEELASEMVLGYVRWRVVNYEEPDNRDLAELFDLKSGSALVLTHVDKDGVIESWRMVPDVLEFGLDVKAARMTLRDAFTKFEKDCQQAGGSNKNIISNTPNDAGGGG